MQESQVTHVSWSFTRQKPEMGLELEDAWPELCPSAQMNRLHKSQYLRIDEGTTNFGEDCIELTLDHIQYPKLGEIINRNRNVSILKDIPRLEDIQDSITVETSCPRSGRRFRRTDKISINLQEALLDSRCIRRINMKRPVKAKINIRKSDGEITRNKMVERPKKLDIRKLMICISKSKVPTPLKRIILLDRDAKAHINIGKRELFEYQKLEANTRDVNSIDFSALKITADPEIDNNYVKRMSELTFYGNDYRKQNEQNMLDNLVSQKCDVLAGLNNLHIGTRRQRNTMIGFDTNCAEKTNNVLENEILPSTVSLRIDDNIKQEITESPVLKQESTLKFSKNFREYCTNILTSELNKSLEKYLSEVSRLQKRVYQKNSVKAKYKRRYYSGLKEVRKHVELNKVKFVIIAPDLEKVELKGGLDDEVYKLLEACKKSNVIFCFGLRRRKIGYYVHGNGFVAAVGIANYGGTEDFFKDVLMDLIEARNKFKILDGKADDVINLNKLMIDSYLLSERINILMNHLAPINPHG